MFTKGKFGFLSNNMRFDISEIIIKIDLSQNAIDPSQNGAVGKRLSNKIDNDIAVARAECTTVAMKRTNFVLDHSIIEEDSFPRHF